MNFDWTGTAKRSEAPESGVQSRPDPVAAERQVALEAQVGQRHRGEHFAPQLDGIRNRSSAADRIECPDTLAQFTAAHSGTRLFEQGTEKLLTSVPLRCFCATAGLIGFLAQLHLFHLCLLGPFAEPALLTFSPRCPNR